MAWRIMGTGNGARLEAAVRGTIVVVVVCVEEEEASRTNQFRLSLRGRRKVTEIGGTTKLREDGLHSEC